MTPELETASGAYVNLTNPDPETIHLCDVAHALSLTCRFGGNCDRFYSVAEHTTHVARTLMDRGYGSAVALAGLHHDDHEYLLGDLPTPLKKLLGAAYYDLIPPIDKVICDRFGVNPFLMQCPSVKDADHWMMHIEARELMVSRGERNYGAVPRWYLPMSPTTLGAAPPDVIEERWLDLHHELRNA